MTKFDYEALTLAQLTDMFNRNVDADQQVKKFRSKAVAIERLQKVLGTTHMEISERTAEREKAKFQAENPEAGKVKKAPRSHFDKTLRVFIIADGNPKREGTESAAAFDNYVHGETVKYHLENLRDGNQAKARADLNWDQKKGFIVIARREDDVPQLRRERAEQAAIVAEEDHTHNQLCRKVEADIEA